MNKFKAEKATREIRNKIYKFDSKAEATYFDKLYQLAVSGEITSLSTQPEFSVGTAYTITVNGKKKKIQSLRYTPDFKYEKDGEWYVVEVKGKKTTDYTMRKKLFLIQAKDVYNVDYFIEVVSGVETEYQCGTVRRIA